MTDTITLVVPDSPDDYRPHHVVILERFLSLHKSEQRERVRALSDEDAQRFVELGDWVRRFPCASISELIGLKGPHHRPQRAPDSRQRPLERHLPPSALGRREAHPGPPRQRRAPQSVVHR